MASLFDDFDFPDEEADDGLVGVADEETLPVPKGRRQFAIQHLVKRGLSPEDAAAMVWNFSQESGKNLNTKLSHDGGTGYGIAGFRDPSPGAGRWTNLRTFAKANNANVDDQLDFAVHELNGPEAKAYAAIKAAQSPEDKARAAISYFRPYAPYARDRASRAREVLALLNGTDTGEPVTGNNTPMVTVGGMRKQPTKDWPIQSPDDGESYDPATEAPQSAFEPLASFAQEALESLDRTPEEVAALEQPYVAAPTGMLPLLDPAIRAQQDAEGRQTVLDVATRLGTDAANLPWNIMSLGALPWVAMGGTNPYEATIQHNKEVMENTIGGDPETTAAKIVSGAAGGVVPGNVPASLAMGAVNVASDVLAPSAHAASARGPNKATLKKQENDKAIDQTVQFIREGLPFNPGMTQFDLAERPVITEARNDIAYGTGNGKFVIVQGPSGRFHIIPENPTDASQRAAVTQANARGGLEAYPAYGTQSLAQNAADRMTSLLGPEIERRKMMVQTIGGPMAFDPKAAMIYGGAAILATTGMIFAPRTYRLLKRGAAPPLARDVAFAPTDVGAISTPGDYVRTTVDYVNQGLINVAKRAGLDPDAVTHIKKKFNIETRGAAQILADSAVENGNMRSLDYAFKVKVPMAELNKTDSPELTQYLNLRNIVEHFNEAQTKNMMNPRTKPAPTTIRGFDETTALRMINDMERVNPVLRDIHKEYAANVKAMNRFMADGEFALITRPQLTMKNAVRPTFIPGMDKQIGEAVPIGSATATMGDYMKTQIRLRLENEAKGRYIDSVKDLDIGRGKKLFVKLTPAEIRENPKWAQNTVTIYRYGKKEVYATDPFLADLLRMDPYYPAGQMKYVTGAKNLFQSTTTGALAPWFAATSFFRNQKLMRTSAPTGMKSTNVLKSAWAIPEQLMPQLAKSIGESLDRGNGGWIRSVVGDANADAISANLLNRWKSSFQAQLEASGTHYGSVLEQQIQGNKNLNAAVAASDPSYAASAKAIANTLWRGYNASLQAVHNAPAFAFAKKNRNLVNMNPAELAFEARRLTGNPMVGGQTYTGDRPIRFEGTGARVKAAKAMGHAAEFGRSNVPWFNTTLQGNKRLVQAYLENPAKFTARVWLYSQMPAAASYLLARGLGTDQNGASYAEYMINGRSEWDRMMYTYIPIPGLPVEKGIRIPNVHEFSLAGVLMQDALHHATASNIFSMQEDALRAAQNFRDVMSPGMFIQGTAAMGMMGIRPPMGAFGGEPYMPRKDEHNAYNNGVPMGLETFVRAMAPGISDIFFTGLAAATNSTDKMDAPANFMSAAGKRVIEKMPLVRDVFGMQAPMSGNTRIMNEYYDQKKEIDALLNRFTRWDKEGDKKDGSKSGLAILDQFIRPKTVTSRAGIDQPEATNPMYNEFIAELYDKFKHDAAGEGGGVGFITAANRMRDMTSHLKELRNVNDGNYGVWLKQVEKDKPDLLNEFTRFGVNYHRLNDVKSFFTQQQQDVAKHLLFMIKTVENDLTKKARAQGKIPPDQSVKFKDLAPFD